MIQLITGEKGKGKTKVLLDKANEAAKNAKGSLVFVDKDSSHILELKNSIRLVDVSKYGLSSSAEFYGFAAGLISADHDLEQLYIDAHEQDRRKRTALQAEQDEKEREDHAPAPHPFFRARALRGEHGIIDEKLPEQEGDVVDLQGAHKAFRLSEGNDAGHNGGDALPDAVLGHFQQHDGGVCGAHAGKEGIDRSVLKQVTHEDGVEDGDRLKQDLLPRPADGGRL